MQTGSAVVSARHTPTMIEPSASAALSQAERMTIDAPGEATYLRALGHVRAWIDAVNVAPEDTAAWLGL